ncbi:valine--tRNA ligase [bacterium BMS3Abin04]|nr:valine--tRNA ligase [bacterium BMS3Abin04]
MPFITEELWHLIAEREDGKSISTSMFPDYDETKVSKNAEDEMEFVQNVITALRNIRGELSIPPSKKIDALLKTGFINDTHKVYIKSLAKVNELTVDPALQKPSQSASAVVKGCDIFVPLKGIIDLDVERARIEKEIARLENALKGVEKKLSNEKFVNNAPEEVVEKERNKKENWESSLSKLKEILEELN